ncbi:hypothetical protein Tco_0218271 [Tanacetum coccineum]
MDNPNITMEEYVRYETEKALRNGQMYNWETTKYGKINYIGDINYPRFFETKFPAIIYDDALSSQHVDEVNWKNKTSLSEYDDGKYNAIFNKVLFSYDIFFVSDLKSDKDNVDNKISIEESSRNIFIEPLRNIISIDIDIYAQVSNVLWKTKVMEFESAQSNTTAKLHILKLGEYEIKMSVPVTAEEKTNKNNDVKARSLLFMALPNEHQLTFSQYTYLKQCLLLSKHDVEKIVSRLAILGVVIAQEDLNSKILNSLPPEWNTHVVVWMNKAENETMSG